MVIRRSFSRRSRSGVLLVDLLVATVLLGIALGVMLSITGRAIESQRLGKRMAIAAMLVDEQLQLVVARGPDDYGKRFPLEGPCDDPYGEFKFKLEISGGSSGDPFDVTSTIMWEDNGRPQTAVVKTRLAPRVGEDTDPDRKPQESVVRN